MYKGPNETAGNLRHGVIARTTPRIAPQDAPHGQSQSLEGSMLQDSLSGIFRTSRLKATRRRCIGSDAYLIEADGQQEYPGEHFLYPFP